MTITASVKPGASAAKETRRLVLRLSPHSCSGILFSSADTSPSVELCFTSKRKPGLAPDTPWTGSEISAAIPIAARKSKRLDTIAMLPVEIGAVIQLDAPDPSLSPSDARESLKWQLSEKTGFDVSESEVEAFEIPDADRGGLLKKTWWTSAVPSKTIRETLLALDAAGLECSLVVPETLALAHYAPPLPGGKAIAFLCVGDDSSSISFVCGGRLLFQKQFEWTRQSFRDKSLFDRITLDFQRTVDYFDRRLSAVALGSVVVAGLDPYDLEQWRDHASMALLVKISPFDPSAFFQGAIAPLCGPDAAMLSKMASLALGTSTPGHAVHGANFHRPFVAVQRAKKRKTLLAASSAAILILGNLAFFAYCETSAKSNFALARELTSLADKSKDDLKKIRAISLDIKKDSFFERDALADELAVKKALLSSGPRDPAATSAKPSSILSEIQTVVSERPLTWIDSVAVERRGNDLAVSVVGRAKTQAAAQNAVEGLLSTSFGKGTGFSTVVVSPSSVSEGDWSFEARPDAPKPEVRK